jgi:hypothetical protein
MARWSEVESEAPELAARALEFFDANKHKTLATLRRDGSPRISGTEMMLVDGDVWLGSMWRSMKALDLLRDPRFALHSASEPPDDWKGDAKIAGRMVETNDPEKRVAMSSDGTDSGDWHLFRAGIDELVVVSMGDPRDHIVIEAWHAGRGLSRRERR